VISDDENTSSQACRRKNARQRCSPRTPMHIEHEYFRCGAWTYVSAPDVHRTRGFRSLRNQERHPFHRRVEQVMT
jgi:hypothetical protein